MLYNASLDFFLCNIVYCNFTSSDFMHLLQQIRSAVELAYVNMPPLWEEAM